MATKHSTEGRLEIQSDGVAGVAGYVALDLIGSARFNAQRTATAVPKRGSQHKTFMTGQADVEISFAMTWDDADAVVALIEAANFANTHLGVKFLDDTAGTGYTADMLVTGYEHGQDDDGVQVVNVTMKPTYIATDPAWA